MEPPPEASTPRRLAVADLLRLRRSTTGASSLLSSSPSHPPADSTSQPRKKPKLSATNPATTTAPFAPIPPLVLLAGTLSLPSAAAWRNHCLSLSDPSSAASICCYLLDFDPAAIGREILVLAWNYLPSVRQHEAGVLEAVRWCLAEAPGLVPGPSFLTAIPLDCVDAEPALATRGRVFGVVRSVSVVFTVPRPSDDPPPRSLPGWTVRGNCQTPLGDLDANFLRGSSNRLLRGRDLWAIWVCSEGAAIDLLQLDSALTAYHFGCIWADSLGDAQVAAHAGICDGVPRGDLWFKPGGSVEFCHLWIVYLNAQSMDFTTHLELQRAEMMCCGCRQCKVSPPESDRGHRFQMEKFVYFVHLASRWRPVLARLIGRPVSVTGLKKKMVSVGKKSSYTMLVSSTETMVSWCSSYVGVPPLDELPGKCSGVYTGVVSGIYMQDFCEEIPSGSSKFCLDDSCSTWNMQ